jgi:hypothetical protein
VRNWKVYVGLLSEVKNLLIVLPLVNLLHSPAMEPRHWEDLKVSTGKQSSLMLPLTNFSFCVVPDLTQL